MSPIPSIATAPTFFTPDPLPTLDPGSLGQTAPTASHYLLGTGGFLFAVVAVVSVAGYFYHGRGAANATRKSNTWSSLTGLLSSIRNIGSATEPAAPAIDKPVYFENDPGHVNMIYAKFFHPIFWDVVECHPATASAPAIFVEDETHEIPLTGPQPFGLNSFLSMDEDGNDEDGKANSTTSHEKSKKDTKAQVPPYDISSPIDVNFVSKIIGNTVRLGGFLHVPGQVEDDSSENLDSTPELDLGSLAYDGIVTTPLMPRPSNRRHGVADMEQLAESLNGALAEGEELMSTVSFQAGLSDLLEYCETERVPPCIDLKRLETLEYSMDYDNKAERCAFSAASHESEPNQNTSVQLTVDDTPTDSTSNTASIDSCDSFPAVPSDGNALGVPHSSADLMWKLYDECWEAVGDTLFDISTFDSDVADETRFFACDVDPVKSCKPLRLRGIKNNGLVVPDYDVGVHDNGTYVETTLSKCYTNIDHRTSNIGLSSCGSCSSVQDDSSVIETLKGPDELEDLMSEIYAGCLQSANNASMLSNHGIAIYGSPSDMQLDTPGTAPQMDNVPQILLTECPANHDLVTSNHPVSFLGGCDGNQDSLTDVDTIKQPDDIEDLLAQIHAEYLYWSSQVEADTVGSDTHVVHDGYSGMQISQSNPVALGAPGEGSELMQRILIELRNPGLDLSPRDISEDSGSEYSNDDGDDVDEHDVSLESRRNSLESDHSSNCAANSDMSDEGSAYPLTPPPVSAISAVSVNILEGRMSSVSALDLRKETKVVPPLPVYSPSVLPREAYVLDISLDSRPSSLSEGTESQCGDDIQGETSIPRPRPPWGPHEQNQDLLGRTFPSAVTDHDLASEREIYLSTPLPMTTAPVANTDDNRKGPVSPEIPGIAQEVRVALPSLLHSPPALPTKVYIPTHRKSHSSLHGPRLPLLDLPRI